MQVFEQRRAQFSDVSGAHDDDQVARLYQLHNLRQRIAQRRRILSIAWSGYGSGQVLTRKRRRFFATNRLVRLYENEPVRAAECLAELGKEAGRATAQVGLKDTDYPTVVPLSCRAQRRADFRRMMGVVIHEGYVINAPFAFEASLNALKVAECQRYNARGYAESIECRHAGQSIQYVVDSRHS